MVLYRFLDYYSKFEWEKYCISLYGPIALSSLSGSLAVPPRSIGNLLLDRDSLKSYVTTFSDCPMGSEKDNQSFQQKHLNILDPLRENNNLGRSVSLGNSHRIRKAFEFGARELGQKLFLPSEMVEEKINMFFKKTLERHGSEERPDVQDETNSCTGSTLNNFNGAYFAPSESTFDKSREIELISGKPNADSHEALCDKLSSMRVSTLNTEQRTSMQSYEPRTSMYLTPHTYNTESSYRCLSWYDHNEIFVASSTIAEAGTSNRRHYPSELPLVADPSLLNRVGSGGSYKLNNPASLSADFIMFFANLLFAKWCRDVLVGPGYIPDYLPSHSLFQIYLMEMAYKYSMYTDNRDGMIHQQQYPPTGYYPLHPPTESCSYGTEYRRKRLGTGTYFPHMNDHTLKESPPPGEAVYVPITKPPWLGNNNGRPERISDVRPLEKGAEVPLLQAGLFASCGSIVGNHVHMDIQKAPKKAGTGLILSSEANVEFGSIRPVHEGNTLVTGRICAAVAAKSKLIQPDYAVTQGQKKIIPASTMKKAAMGSNRRRKGYELENNEDFPPLGG